MVYDSVKKLEVVSAIILIGFVFAVVYHYINGFYFNMAYPHNTFLFDPGIKFTDFFSEVNLAKNLMPYDNIQNCRAVYFPFAYIIFYLFGLTGSYSHVYSFVIFILIIYFLLYKFIKPNSLTEYKNILIITFLSYPIIFTIDRGNIETIVFLFIGLFLYFHNKNEDKKAMFFLACAASMKVYPLIFASLYLIRLKLRNIIYLILLTIIISLISLFLFKNDILHSIEGIKSGQSFFKNVYVLGSGGVAYQDSLWGLLRISSEVLKLFDFHHLYMSGLYLIFVVLIYICLLLFMCKIQIKLWENVTIISFCMILFPYVSFDYKLIYIVFPLMFFIRESSGEISYYEVIFTIGFSILLIPKNYYYITENISYSTIINPIIMILLIVYIIVNNLYLHQRN